jgi:Kdo2-lipid IVA lauroyltransferase/acyltransferase
MKKSFGYRLLRMFTLPMQIFPLGFHYWLSDLFFLVIYHILGYRKQVVNENLRNSFPQKTNIEIKQIEKGFYHRFCDMFVETLYFTHINIEKESKRLKVINEDSMISRLDQNRNVILLTGHFGNWEFMQLYKGKFEAKRFFIYKKLSNKAFDRFFLDLRSRAGLPLEMKETPRVLLSKENHPYMAFFISDQRPIPQEIKHWVTFMNQDTPVMLGTEKIAQRTNAAVIYLELKQIRRGYHQATFNLIFDHSAHTKPFEITDKFMAMLEQSINENPSQYFWTHKRWKHKRKV